MYCVIRSLLPALEIHFLVSVCLDDNILDLVTKRWDLKAFYPVFNAILSFPLFDFVPAPSFFVFFPSNHLFPTNILCCIIYTPVYISLSPPRLDGRQNIRQPSFFARSNHQTFLNQINRQICFFSDKITKWHWCRSRNLWHYRWLKIWNNWKCTKEKKNRENVLKNKVHHALRILAIFTSLVKVNVQIWWRRVRSLL